MNDPKLRVVVAVDNIPTDLREAGMNAWGDARLKIAKANVPLAEATSTMLTTALRGRTVTRADVRIMIRNIESAQDSLASAAACLYQLLDMQNAFIEQSTTNRGIN